MNADAPTDRRAVVSRLAERIAGHERGHPTRVAVDGITAINAILVVDGTFLQRADLVEHWDERIWLETSLPAARQRGIARDAVALGGQQAAAKLFDRRYHAACRMYIDTFNPVEHATVLIHNDDLAHPTVEIR